MGQPRKQQDHGQDQDKVTQDPDGPLPAGEHTEHTIKVLRACCMTFSYQGMTRIGEASHGSGARIPLTDEWLHLALFCALFTEIVPEKDVNLLSSV